jgi:hypothetical protein
MAEQAREHEAAVNGLTQTIHRESQRHAEQNLLRVEAEDRIAQLLKANRDLKELNKMSLKQIEQDSASLSLMKLELQTETEAKQRLEAALQEEKKMKEAFSKEALELRENLG